MQGRRMEEVVAPPGPSCERPNFFSLSPKEISGAYVFGIRSLTMGALCSIATIEVRPPMAADHSQRADR